MRSKQYRYLNSNYFSEQLSSKILQYLPDNQETSSLVLWRCFFLFQFQKLFHPRNKSSRSGSKLEKTDRKWIYCLWLWTTGDEKGFIQNSIQKFFFLYLPKRYYHRKYCTHHVVCEIWYPSKPSTEKWKTKRQLRRTKCLENKWSISVLILANLHTIPDIFVRKQSWEFDTIRAGYLLTLSRPNALFDD